MIGSAAALTIIRSGGVHGGGTEDDAGEFGVHGDVRVMIDEVANQFEFGLEIVGPYFPNRDVVRGFGFKFGDRHD